MSVDPSLKERENLVSIEDKVAFLSSAEHYPERPREIETRETHMSWVFLAGDHAYKLKKPVRYRFLDFRTLDARRESCIREMQLNQTLAAGVYLEPVPLTMDEKGNLALGGGGTVIDWLVKMRRLPREHMLDEAIRRDTVGERAVGEVAALLAGFYQHAERVEAEPADYLEQLDRGIGEDAEEICEVADESLAASARRLAEALREFLTTDGAMFVRRAADGKILEGHGDLRPEHICLAPPPAVIDRLNFNRAFRINDPVEELSFLDLECEVLGSEAVGKIVFDTYERVTGDVVSKRLISFFKGKRALLRAKLMLGHTIEPRYGDDPEWRRRAEAYLNCGLRHARELG